MRQIRTLLSALAALSFLTACTTTQVEKASGEVAGSLFIMALDIALDGPERRQRERQRRDNVPGSEWNPCLRACGLARETAADVRLDEVEARKRRIESEEFRAEFDAFMQALEAAEQRSADPPPSIKMATQ